VLSCALAHVSLDLRVEQPHEHRVAQAALDELLLVERVGVVAVHLAEDGLSALLRVVVALAVRLAHQVVDRDEHLLHLLLVDAAVIILVVEIERQLQLLPHIVATRDRDGHKELLEVNLSRTIRVK